MILLEINAMGITVRKFKCDAPWPIHMDGVADWLEASQSMKTPPRYIEVLRLRCDMKRFESDEDPSLQP